MKYQLLRKAKIIWWQFVFCVLCCRWIGFIICTCHVEPHFVIRVEDEHRVWRSQWLNIDTKKQLDDDLKMCHNISVEYYDKGFIWWLHFLWMDGWYAKIYYESKIVSHSYDTHHSFHLSLPCHIPNSRLPVRTLM